MTAICTHESGGSDVSLRIADGKYTSYGYCQIQYPTAQWLGYSGPISELWLNPEVNQLWARKYFEYQLDRYNQDILYAIAAYNAGTVVLHASGHFSNRRYVEQVSKRLDTLYPKWRLEWIRPH